MINDPLQPNGHPQGTPNPSWSPADRKMWMKLHGCPDDMMLISAQEMKALADGMVEQRTFVDQVKEVHYKAGLALGHYGDTEPDFPNGIAAAVFDATKYKKAVDLAIPALRAIKAKVMLFADARSLSDAQRDQVAIITGELASQITDLEKAQAARRQRIALTRRQSPPKK